MEHVQITPEPDEAEREAIVRALAAEDEERPAVSQWARAVLPTPGEDE